METGVRIYNVEPLMEKGHLGSLSSAALQSDFSVSLLLATKKKCLQRRSSDGIRLQYRMRKEQREIQMQRIIK